MTLRVSRWHPPRESVAEALLRLQDIKELLIAAEGKLSVINQQIQAHSPRPRSNMIQAYMATNPGPGFPGPTTTGSGWQGYGSPHQVMPQYQYGGHYEQQTFGQDPHLSRARICQATARDYDPNGGTEEDASRSGWQGYGPPHQVMPQYQYGEPYEQQQTDGQDPHLNRAKIFQATARDYNPNVGTEEDAWMDAAIFLSAAESAIRRATKTSSPPECWGCHGITGLHETRFHLFKDCPHQAREDVRPNFYRHLQEYKEFMRRRRQTGDMTKTYTPGDATNTNENVPMVHSA